MAQQVQEVVHQVIKESRELSWFGSTIMQYHHLQKDNFGISYKIIPSFSGFKNGISGYFRTKRFNLDMRNYLLREV